MTEFRYLECRSFLVRFVAGFRYCRVTEFRYLECMSFLVRLVTGFRCVRVYVFPGEVRGCRV